MSKYRVFSGPYFPKTPWISLFSPNTEKYGSEKTPYLNNFYVVLKVVKFTNNFQSSELLSHFMPLRNFIEFSGMEILRKGIVYKWFRVNHSKLWLCLSTKFPQHEIRWNYGILRNVPLFSFYTPGSIRKHHAFRGDRERPVTWNVLNNFIKFETLKFGCFSLSEVQKYNLSGANYASYLILI